MSNTTNEATQTVHRFRDAYDRLSAEIKAVPQNELIPINVDVPTAITTVLGAMPEISALRSRVAEELPEFDVTRFDRMQDYALALGHAQAIYLAASEPQEPLPELAQEAFKMRDQLTSDATALATRGFIDGRKLGELKGGTGYRAIAFDLFALVAMLREKWSDVSSKTALTAGELDSAEHMADRLITAVGQREQAPAVVGAAVDTRLRAFTLFAKAYDDVRRAVSYFRWHEGDIETIAPSIYAGRNGGSRRKSSEERQGASGSNTPATPSEPAVTPSPVVPVAHVPSGLPGTDPFVNG